LESFHNVLLQARTVCHPLQGCFCHVYIGLDGAAQQDVGRALPAVHLAWWHNKM
jgi:hypothetical protein